MTMKPRKLSTLAFVLGTAFAAVAVAQTTPSPSTSPAAGVGTTPGSVPPATPTPPAPRPSTSRAPQTPAVGDVTGGANRPFSTVDANHDGYVSRAEASSAGLGSQFNALDKNNDGRLDSSEFAGLRTDGPMSQSIRR